MLRLQVFLPWFLGQYYNDKDQSYAVTKGLY
jgi:hypothetical protein